MAVHIDTGLLTSLPGRYAKSLFELAQDNDSVDSYLDALKTLHETISSSPLLKSTLNNPSICWEQEAKAFVEVSRALGLPEIVQNFVHVATKAGRLNVLADIIENYHLLVASLRGEKDVEVISAYSLSLPQQQRLLKALKSKYSDALKVTFQVDPTLLGGLLVRIGGLVVDATLSNRLTQFVTMMKGRA